MNFYHQHDKIHRGRTFYSLRSYKYSFIVARTAELSLALNRTVDLSLALHVRWRWNVSDRNIFLRARNISCVSFS